MKSSFTYIMTNKWHTTLYVGCTSDLIRRVTQHKNHYYKGSFSDRYNCVYCVYYEEFSTYKQAIERENQMKNMKRSEKLALIYKSNPEWKELVTEKGFIKQHEPWETTVKKVMGEILEKKDNGNKNNETKE